MEKASELRKRAFDLGLDTSGTRAELEERLATSDKMSKKATDEKVSELRTSDKTSKKANGEPNEKVSELRKSASDLGLDPSGTREELEQRLAASDKKPASNSIQIVNLTDFDVSSVDLLLNYGSRSCNVPKKSTVTFDLPPETSSFMDKKPEPVTSWWFLNFYFLFAVILSYVVFLCSAFLRKHNSLTLTKKGFTWTPKSGKLLNQSDDQQHSIAVRPGGVYEICIHKAGPLSDENKDHISRRLFELLENGVDFKEIWPTIAAESSFAGKRSVKELMIAYDGGSHNSGERDWVEWYKPANVIKHNMKSGALPEGPWRVCVYYRALDRFPGGNADCHTLMYQFTSNGEVSAFQYSNWDGSHSRGSFVPAALAKSDCISKLSSLLSKWKGPLDSSSTMIDNSADSDEYDSEWSSKEIMVVVPAKWSRATHSIFNEQSRREIWIFLLVNHRLGKPLTRDCMQHLFEFVCPPLWAPVFRLHQYSVNPRERYYQQRAPKKQIPPTKEQSDFHDAIDKMIGMGRVNQFSDAGDGEEPCKAAKDKTKATICTSVDCPWETQLPYLHPIYFRMHHI